MVIEKSSVDLGVLDHAQGLVQGIERVVHDLVTVIANVEDVDHGLKSAIDVADAVPLFVGSLTAVDVLVHHLFRLTLRDGLHVAHHGLPGALIAVVRAHLKVRRHLDDRHCLLKR